MGLRVLKPGLLTTVQDLGRYGYQKYGVIVSGAMDSFALRMCNLLVGNEEKDPALEITATGPTIEFMEDTLIALCGGDMSPSINSMVIPRWRPLLVRRGSTLGFGGLKSGCRVYMSVAGGIHVPEVMGSGSTYLRAAIGGLEGRALVAGDVLTPGSYSAQAIRRLNGLASIRAEQDQPFTAAPWFVSSDLLPAYGAGIVRIVRGREFELFTEESRDDFFKGLYYVTPRTDRMGYRLSGPSLTLSEPLEMTSGAVNAGTIQVPPEGQPLVLMADRQTTGGYPQIGHAVTVDLPVLAQLRPGDRLKFQEISLDEAQSLYLIKELEIKQMKQALLSK